MIDPRDLGVVPVVGTVVGFGCLYGSVVGLPIAGLNPTGQRVLGLFFFALVMWLTKPVPFAVSSLTTVSLLYVLGLADSFATAAAGFSSRLIFFLILLLLLGNTISKVDLDELLARRLLVADSPRETIRLTALSLLALSFMMPSALARAVAFLPIVEELDDLWPGTENFRFDAHLILGHVNPVASMGLMTGGGMAILSSEFVRTSVTYISWLDWAVLMLPPTAFIFLLATATILLVHPVGGGTSASRPDEAPTAESFDRDQRIVVGVMVTVIVLWVVGSFLGIPTILPPTAAVFFLALPGIGIVAAEDMRTVSWGIIFVFGTMFSLLEVLESAGVLSWVVGNAEALLPFTAVPIWGTVALLLALAFVVRLFFSTASAALLVLFPVMLRFADAFGVDPLYLSLSLVMIVGSSTVFPFNTTTVLLTYDKGSMTAVDVMATGLITTVYAAVAVVLCWTLYWPLVA
ncbi:SLC13 family permease [Haloplanus aerogenes]|uniref:Anion transporter n=1 Tax=Haloplanus aerogenes TaxID=660522 RepID=A0A3M0DSE2_9EURY|nr:SLC13 family permease [Haloplanus aerogenes]AZH25332.1 SLC13 family permease [Haloplanus aerogenes]RMB25029.1 anion transporter [Haloplanus aerogenes]